jgi:hypothetical protein
LQSAHQSIWYGVAAGFNTTSDFISTRTGLQGFNRYSYCTNNPLKYTDPSGYRRKPDGWDLDQSVALNGGISPGGRMGPGSGKHWSDGFHGSYSYNWRSGLYLDNKGGVASYETVFNNYIQPNSSLPSEGKYAIGSISLGNRGIWLQYTIRYGYDDLIGVNSQANELFGSETINSLIGFSGSFYKDFWDDAQGGGGNLLKDLTDITGWASTIRTAGEMDWNSMTKAQQQKVAYNMQKSLKSNGTRMYTRDIKANINGNFKSLNYKLGAASGLLIVADVYMKGEIRPSHVVNGIMTGVGLSGWGSPVAAVYFLTDLGMGLFYDGGLSGYIDDTWGSPLYDF